jgi:DNA-binding LacI/PurR family transcriptional regulator
MSTLKDIARQADVSICTVSRYINKKIKIKDQTARRIDEAIETLSYIPNNAAKTLKTNCSTNVALLIPTLNNLVFAESAHEIEAVFRREGYSVFIYGSENDINREKQIVPRLIENRVAGVLLNTLPHNYENLLHLKPLEKNGIPFVFLNRMFSPVPIPSVYADYQGGAFLSTEYLLKSGRKKVALLIGRSRQPQSHANILGYRAAFKASGLSGNDELIFECDYEHDKIPGIVAYALENGIDAFYCMTDLMAIHVMTSVRASGRTVPDDVALIGAGNTAFSTIVHPPLTSVDLQNRMLGRKGAELLLDILKERTFEKSTVLETVLIHRDSA